MNRSGAVFVTGAEQRIMKRSIAECLKAERRIMKRSRAECLEAVRCAAEDNVREWNGDLGSRGESNEMERSGVFAIGVERRIT